MNSAKREAVALLTKKYAESIGGWCAMFRTHEIIRVQDLIERLFNENLDARRSARAWKQAAKMYRARTLDLIESDKDISEIASHRPGEIAPNPR